MTDRASRTALAVATGRAVGLRDLHDPLAMRFLPAWQRRIATRLRRIVAAGSGGEALVATATAGLTTHAALRMAAVDRAVTTAVDDGAGQVVVVGAGFDTRAWRLPVLGGLRVVEVDLPTIQRLKVARLTDVDPVADVSFVAADLATTSLDDALATSGHAVDVRTTWVWEAVAPYLPPTAVTSALQAMADRSAPGSHLIMTYAHPDLVGGPALGRLLSPIARGVFAGLGEPLLSVHTDEEIRSAAAAAGWIPGMTTAVPDWARAEGRPAPRTAFAAEHLLTATR